MKKYFLIIGLLIVVSASSFYFGGYVGFSQGYYFAEAQQAPIDASTTAVLLNAIRNNKIDSAVSLLETMLDSAINGHNHLKKFPSFFGLRFYDKKKLIDEASIDLMKKACKYRQEYPGGK